MTGFRTSARRHLGRFTGILGGALIVLLGILIESNKVIDLVTQRRAQAIIADLSGANPQETTISVAKWVATQFKQGLVQPVWYRKYGFVLSHRIMPEFLRLKRGSLALL